MQRFPFVFPARIVASAILAVAWATALAQQTKSPVPPDVPSPSATAARLSDTLMARATGLYYSAAKAGLKSFDCQVHPDWKVIVSSARKGAAVADNDPKLALLNTVKVTLHTPITGDPSLDWQVPQSASTDGAARAMLDQAHHGLEQTLEGLLKLWIPLVDGSVAESLGEEDAEISQTANGFALRVKDKSHSVIEEFDKSLILKRFVTVDSGSTVDMAPSFQPAQQGLLPSSFVAHIRVSDTPPGASQEMHVSLNYQSISGVQIPALISMEMSGVVRMDFALDGCTVNPK